MITELTVRDLGVIAALTLELPDGMIALTGETGAGKTLVVDAISLLVGGRADSVLVREGADAATVDARVEIDGTEHIVSRVIPATGRSRAYLDGRPIPASKLSELGAGLVDLHGQHAHQSLLGVDAQRDALDRFGGVDTTELDAARAKVSELLALQSELGGDDRARLRQIDLLRYQVDELDAAQLDDPNEDAVLAEEEERLAFAVEHQQAGLEAGDLLAGESESVRDGLVAAMGKLSELGPFTEVHDRLAEVLAELDDARDTLRALSEAAEPDPERLDEVQTRRRLLSELRKKYGATLSEVMEEQTRLRDELAALENAEARAAVLDDELAEANAEVAAAAEVVAAARNKAAPGLAEAIQQRLRPLAMPKATFAVVAGGDDGGEVEFRLAANPGSTPQPLSKVASGGELARTMLAVRGVLSESPPVLVFDEIDAGIGGEAGQSIGHALAKLGRDHQVLVVTHLPQVAAVADTHLMVRKTQSDTETVSEVRQLDDDERITELARMLSGQPDSEVARQHAVELRAEMAGKASGS